MNTVVGHGWHVRVTAEVGVEGLKVYGGEPAQALNSIPQYQHRLSWNRTREVCNYKFCYSGDFFFFLTFIL